MLDKNVDFVECPSDITNIKTGNYCIKEYNKVFVFHLVQSYASKYTTTRHIRYYVEL